MATTTYKELNDIKFNLSPSQLAVLDISNKKTAPLRSLLDRKLNHSDKGYEIGSINYISKSKYYFIRSKALTENSRLLSLSEETAVPILPQVFKNYNLTQNDIIISKDSNIGESIILDKDYPNYSMSGALYKLPITKNKYYIFAFLKHEYFKKQLDLAVPKGSTIRHAKTLFLDSLIPFPNQSNRDQIIKYVELLTLSIINKEKEIRRKNQLIHDLIKKELIQNQLENDFLYQEPKLKELFLNNRIDSGFYCRDYKLKQFQIKNYKHGAKTITDWGYKSKRGQNLQVSQIGRSIYSDTPRDNFYTLIRPTNFTDFGTVEKFEYFGNACKLSVLEAGDIVFSAEGTIGKCVLFATPSANWITNIHGIVFNKKGHNIEESSYVSCFLRFLKEQLILDYISVGGQGGSLAKKYWNEILIPKFPSPKIKEIANLYYNPIDYPSKISITNFLSKDNEWNESAGIIEIDQSIKKIDKRLTKVLDSIINDQVIEIEFPF